VKDTGWPLIPREELPAPVKPAKSRFAPRLPLTPGEAGRQLSIFGAETTEPSPADLAGLLAGPGRLGRMGGTARVSVTVDAAWRVHVLVTELVSRGLVVNWQEQHQEDVRDNPPPIAPDSSTPLPTVIKDGTSVRTTRSAATFDPDADPLPDLPSDVDFLPAARDAEPAARDTEPAARDTELAARDTAAAASDGAATAPDGGAEEGAETPELPEPPPKPRFEVTTAYSSRLNPLARAWPDAAAQLFLSGPRLRLWVAAAGEPVPGGYALGLGPAKDSPEQLKAIDAALVRAGLAGRLADDRSHYIIAGRRRLRRLAELVGERPAAAPPELWPGGPGA
jgi:hypothetical protein